ncbi:hypothetical protein CDO52_25695 [Nocardiopsis gilva YIM 90087]|uniref:Uncharacterized protein n=1 Tax=Nocardiopsis gilva YIM 90087 TaxID=1235441 RepID=A0A223SE80_9ACTN|nr:hypothetical protein [Nocardiopsis gilva]ASU86435.1 hypothetical protein CDO52_25695 [Nocardiopsis gilva YIM 90087]
MGDILSALIPPAVVAAVFCTFVVKLLRKEMAPRTSDGRLVSEVDDATGSTQGDATTATPAGSTTVAVEDGAKGADGSSSEVPADRPDAADR